MRQEIWPLIDLSHFPYSKQGRQKPALFWGLYGKSQRRIEGFTQAVRMEVGD